MKLIFDKRSEKELFESLKNRTPIQVAIYDGEKQIISEPALIAKIITNIKHGRKEVEITTTPL
jgi:hypothetical protein